MKSKELSLPLKQDIIRLKNENKPIREIAKTLGVAKSTIWYILKKERSGQLRNYQRTGRPRVTSVVDDRRILALLEKNPLTTVDQIKNTLQELGVFVSKSTIKRRVQQSRYRGFTRRFTPALEAMQGAAEKDVCKEELQTVSNCKVEAMEGECSDAAAESDKHDVVAEEVEVSSAPTQQSPASAEVVERGEANQSGAEQDEANQSGAEQDEANQSGAEQDEANQNGAEQGEANQSEAEQSEANQSEAEQDDGNQNEDEQDKVDRMEDDVEQSHVAIETTDSTGRDGHDELLQPAEQGSTGENELSSEMSSEVTMSSQDPPPPSDPDPLPTEEIAAESTSVVTATSHYSNPLGEPGPLPAADDWSTELPTDDLFTVPMSQTSNWGGAKDWS